MKTSPSLRVTFFPDIMALAGNPYWAILKDGLEAAGAEYVTPDGPLLRWLWRARHDPVVLHLHFVQQFYAYEGEQARLRWVLRLARNLLLARLWGHRVVFTLHNLTPTYPLQPEWVDRLGHRLAIRLADAVIVHCETAHRLLTQTYGRSRGVHVVPHPHYIGVYPDTVSRREARARFGYDSNEIVLAFVGGLRPNKGVDRLVRVFRRCDDPRLRLLIAGAPGPSAGHIEAIRDIAAEDSRIRLCLGHIPDAEMQYYYHAADVVVLPFSRILTSGSAMLAMSFGRAVIVPRMGCLGELPEDVAVLYEPGSDESLKQAILNFRSQRSDSIGGQSRSLVENSTREKFASGTLEAYAG